MLHIWGCGGGGQLMCDFSGLQWKCSAKNLNLAQHPHDAAASQMLQEVSDLPIPAMQYCNKAPVVADTITQLPCSDGRQISQVLPDVLLLCAKCRLVPHCKTWLI